ncbi:DUF1611 domain-containing protein [Halobacteriales archaeon SW_5_70_135]|nr:MAG: DUF1611 domain-containing protein [Halobacteriales archaeon SW_5_70_135]
MERIAVLAHGQFPDRAKTAVGLLRYGDREVVAVLDRDRAGERVAEAVPDVQDAPVYRDCEALVDDRGPDVADTLVIGVAPIGGGFESSWRPDVRTALGAGWSVEAGLHYRLGDDDEFATLAAEHGCELRDVREPPVDLTVAEGVADEVGPRVVLTVGTDCSVGKMTTAMELVDAARERGVDARAVPTGQTGIMVEGWGIAVDRAVSDFANGAVERLVRAGAGERPRDRPGGEPLPALDEPDLLVVEGQGSIVHPAYSAVTSGLLHGAMPDALVLCHAAGREAVHGYEDTPLPAPGEYVDLYESLAAPVGSTAVVAGSLNTAGLEPGAARTAVEEFAAAIDAPATDPIRHGAGDLVEAVL